MSLDLPFDNSYAALPERFYSKLAPTPVAEPSLIALNHALAESLGLDAKALETSDGVAALAGNVVPGGADPLAQVYAGHQFGGWSPRLGDGRAILLGEVIAPSGERFDIQLKGSGPTPYSRMGDGRSWLGPVMREYIVSEAMHALGVPTTRALAAVSTGETVVRDEPLPGAVFTRVASSHIRVGTFQYFASQNDVEGLEALVAYALSRHDADKTSALELLDGVVRRQARLVSMWMGLGFIHGVMNTDNMTISGETIDYGPCAFMDAYHPLKVFSSIDSHGRYAFARQPDVAMWNLAQLATALLPLIPTVEDAQGVIDQFPDLFRKEWLGVFRAKIGLRTEMENDSALLHDFMDRMAANGTDFTNIFRALGSGRARDQFADREVYDDWDRKWRDRLALEDGSPENRKADMDATNPAVIPRNHRIEQAIKAGVAGDYAPFHRLNGVLQSPFELSEANEDLARPPSEEEIVHRTFCGT